MWCRLSCADNPAMIPAGTSVATCFTESEVSEIFNASIVFGNARRLLCGTQSDPGIFSFQFVFFPAA
jgi:hypothetical protein